MGQDLDIPEKPVVRKTASPRRSYNSTQQKEYYSDVENKFKKLAPAFNP